MIDALSAELFKIGCVQFGQFTLKDGRTSPFYVDLRLLISHPGVLRLVAQAMLAKSRGLHFDRIAGLPYAGLPIAVAMAIEGNLPALYPRKESKGYGTQRQVEGICPPGDRVLVIDDVVTSGGAKLEGLAPLRDAGLVVSDILVLVDRSTDAATALSEAGVALHSVLRIEDLLRSLRKGGMMTGEQLEAALAFMRGGMR